MFAGAQGLKFHIQRVHEHSGRYACEYCDFKTVAQMKLDIHVNEVHTKAVKFHCQECNFSVIENMDYWLMFELFILN